MEIETVTDKAQRRVGLYICDAYSLNKSIWQLYRCSDRNETFDIPAKKKKTKKHRHTGKRKNLDFKTQPIQIGMIPMILWGKKNDHDVSKRCLIFLRRSPLIHVLITHKWMDSDTRSLRSDAVAVDETMF